MSQRYEASVGFFEGEGFTYPVRSSLHHVGCFKSPGKSSMPSNASPVFWDVFDAAHIIWKRWEMVENRHHLTLLWISSKSRKPFKHRETFEHFFPEEKFVPDGGCKLVHNFVLVWSQSTGVSSSLEVLNLNHTRTRPNQGDLHRAGLSS